MKNWEKRQHKRVESRYIINCRREKDTACGTDAISRDISATGILFESPCSYEVGENLHIEMTLPGWDLKRGGKAPQDEYLPADVHAVLATVVRQRKNPDGYYEVAVCFNELNPEDKTLLGEYLGDRYDKYDL